MGKMIKSVLRGPERLLELGVTLTQASHTQLSWPPKPMSSLGSWSHCCLLIPLLLWWLHFSVLKHLFRCVWKKAHLSGDHLHLLNRLLIVSYYRVVFKSSNPLKMCVTGDNGWLSEHPWTAFGGSYMSREGKDSECSKYFKLYCPS